MQWSGEMAKAFETAKRALAAAVSLDHPQAGAALSLAVDASDAHVGAVLQQQSLRGWRPLAFFSRKLSPAESRYSTFDRELLACVSAIRHFRFMLEGRQFHILTDHKPLTHALHRISDPWSARQQRHLASVAEYTADIRHIAGAENVVADALSRPAATIQQEQTRDGHLRPDQSRPPAAVQQEEDSPGLVFSVVSSSKHPAFDWAQLAASQGACADVANCRASPSLQVQEVGVRGHKVWCDVSTGVIRPLVPAQQRRLVFDQIHSLTHAGVRASTRLISARFVWPGLAADVKAWCRECVTCNTAKAPRQEKAPLEHIPIPQTKFSHVHVDLLGPWPVSQCGHTHLLTIIDRTTRWPEACPLRGISAEEVLQAFLATWVARYGVPSRITSDRGVQFTSAVWGDWCRLNAVHHVTTTAYHPQSNGMVERLHRQMKEALRARNAATAWIDHLPWVMLGIRATPKDDSGVSAAQAALGHQLSVPGQLPPPLDFAAAAGSSNKAAIPVSWRSYAQAVAGGSSPLDAADFVYVRRGGAHPPLADSYSGPFQVLERGSKFFRLRMGTREDTVSRDRLKAHLGELPPELAMPPTRGRPPGDRRR